MKTYFLDFDGVLFDSIDECYQNTVEVFELLQNPIPDAEKFKSLFYEYRYLVRPAREYLFLGLAVINCLKSKVDIKDEFYKLQNEIDPCSFASMFFKNRHRNQVERTNWWIELNRPTPFFHYVKSLSDIEIVIVTTKDKQSVETLLQHFGLPVKSILGKEDYDKSKNKGLMIAEYLNSYGGQNSIFIDDSLEHLETVKDERISKFFAPWGYEKNTSQIPDYKF